MGESGHVQDVPVLPGTLGRDGQWEWSCLEWESRDMSRMSLGFRDSGTGWTVGMELSRVGESGHVQDVRGLPGILGRDGQWEWSCLEWESRDMSRMSLCFPELWDGMDSGNGAV